MSRITSIMMIALVFGLASFAGLTGEAQAYQLTPKVTFTFDDGSKTIYDNGLPALAKHNLPAVLFGESGPLNSGEAWVMSWDQIRELQNTYNWEIGSHSISHPYLTQISSSQLTQELLGSKQDFAAQGIEITAFASPYGDYNNAVKAEIAKYYQSHRAAWGGSNQWLSSFNDYEIVSQEASYNTSPATIKSWIDDAITNNQWLVILLHSIVEGEANPYEYNVDDFAEIVDYVAAQPIEVTAFTDALKFSGQPNLVNNFTFSQVDATGFAENWSRTNSSKVSVDTSNHGNVYGSQNSIKIVAGVQQYEAQSDILAVNSSQDYLLRMYHNVQNLVSGGSAVWISEFDSNGAWLGGQWLGGNYANYVGYRYYEYSPTSQNVAKIKIHIFTEENSQLTFYFDSVELKALGSDVAEPIEGCTDPLANNYNPEATTDDGSCTYDSPAPVCGNNILEEPEQCDDGNNQDGDGCSAICEIEVPIEIEGCTDPLANNYNPEATIDDGSCEYDPVVEIQPGDLIINEVHLNPNGDSGSVTDQSGEWFELYNSSGRQLELQGCTIKDNGVDSHVVASSLVLPIDSYAVLGVNADSASNGGTAIDYQYASYILANLSDEVIIECASQEIDRVEYSSSLGFPSGTSLAGVSMILADLSSENNLGSNWCVSTSPFGDGFDLGTPGGLNDSCSVIIEGCTDSLANNYNPEATVDDDSCTYDPPAPVCGNNITEEPEQCDDGNNQDGDGCSAICEIEVPIEIEGCTDPLANNYNPEATIDDGSCAYDNPNLVPNFSFEILDNDWAVDWSYLDVNVRIDTQGNGFDPFPLSSLRIVAGPNQRVAVSSLINIDSSKLYELSYFIKILNFLAGGTAVWIDEFAANGDYLSGAWLGGLYSDPGDGIVSYDYTPTSEGISKIQIHLFTEENSSMRLYIDSVVLKEK